MFILKEWSLMLYRIGMKNHKYRRNRSKRAFHAGEREEAEGGLKNGVSDFNSR